MIKKEVLYINNMNMDSEDEDHSSSLYDYSLYNIPITIALGKPKYDKSEKYNIIYFFIYLIINNETVAKIGIFEIEKDIMINNMDDDDDIDLSKGKIIITVNENYLQKIMEKYKKADDDDDTLEKIEKQQVDNDVDDIIEIEESPEQDDVFSLNIPKQRISEIMEKTDEKLKDGIFIMDTNKNVPDKLILRNQWIEKFMNEKDYGIIDNDGNGDCFFLTLIDAFNQIGKYTTVDKLRALLSKNATETIYNQYRILYMNFYSEYQTKEAEIKLIKKQISQLKTRIKNTLNKSEDNSILEEANLLAEKYKKLNIEKKETAELLKEFDFMENIDTFEKFREFILTRDFWADTWAVSTLENHLNIKIIILSEESYKNGDLDSVMNCGQLNDSDLEKQGQYVPDYYIIVSYTGNHYKLITYNEKRIFKFKEIPYAIKALVIKKCMEKNSGPYYLIQDFRNMKTSIGLDANEGEPVENEDEYLNSELYDKETVFMFHSNSNHTPIPGKGSGEKILDDHLSEFIRLNKIKDWRRKLDDSWEAPINIDGHRWQTVEHYYLGSQFKKGFPDFYLKFSLDNPNRDADINSDIATDITIARLAGGKTGKTKDRILRDKSIRIDSDFFEIGVNTRSEEERKSAITAKFTQNLDLKNMLLETKNAKLVHFVRGREPETDILLMNLRKELRTG
jgi:hypothetical protein